MTKCPHKKKLIESLTNYIEWYGYDAKVFELLTEMLSKD